MNGGLKFGLMIAAAVLMTTVPAAAAEKYALLIGVAKYEHSGMSVLKYPENDASDLGELLRSGGYKVELLLGKAATGSAIREKLETLRTQGTAEGVVLLGLFGHGVEVETVNGDEVSKEGCFCPYDTDLRVAKDFQGRMIFGKDKQPVTEPNPASLVKLTEVLTTFKLAKSGHRVLLADCCRVTPNQARGRSFGSGFKAADLPENSSVLFGCSPNEQAFEHADWGHGAFTKSLLDQLPLLASQGKVTTGTLADKLREQVPKLVVAVSPRETQTPKLFSTDSVDLQLVLEQDFAMTTTNTIGMRMMLIPSGEFLMGFSVGDVEEVLRLDHNQMKSLYEHCQPQHLVKIPNPFYMGAYEVSQGEWTKVMKSNPSWFSSTGGGKREVVKQETDRFPVENVSWYDAVDFTNKLSELEGLPPYYNLKDIEWKNGSILKATVTVSGGAGYRLPSEVEWEYSARSGTKTLFWFGSVCDGTASNVNASLAFGIVERGKSLQRTTMVGSYRSNDFGLYDTAGNVFEWCEDLYDKDTYSNRLGLTIPFRLDFRSKEQKEREVGSRVNRGGDWYYSPAMSFSANRHWEPPGFHNNSTGFRVARSSTIK